MIARRLTALLVALLLVLLGLALFTNLFGGQLIPGLPFVRVRSSERFATSSITLESMHELSSFATVRYVHRAVFPYDYLPDGVSLNAVLQKLRDSRSLTDEALTPDEALFWSTYRLADEIDLSVTGGTFDFVVVTLMITAGYDLGSGVTEVVVERIPGTASGRSAASGSETGRRAVVTLGPPAILEIGVEDIDRDDYPYPDTALGAESWRKVSEYVRERSVPQAVIDEILAAARRNGEEFIRAVLVEAGFAEVVFDDPR
jgi:hypothetical protein